MMLLSVPPTTTLSPPTILLLHLHILTTIASVGVLGAPPTNNKTDHRQEPRQTPLKYYNKQIEYSGPEFFNGWTFFNQTDPSHGLVNYVDHDTAFSEGLAFFTTNQTPGIQADHWTHLNPGQLRNSIRLQSLATFNGGLFIIDLGLMPWGCGVWPSFWTLGYGAPWPQYGEIDIIEGIQSSAYNKVSIHTEPGCTLDTTPGLYKGHTAATNCDSSTGGSGCSIDSTSNVSYGQNFNAMGGGVFAMLWDDSAIQVWDWSRNDIPVDIAWEKPNPSGWGLPSAYFSSSTCNIADLFTDNQLVFTINLCGDWAGNLYNTFSYCPGTCAEQIANPANLENSIFLINYIKVFQPTDNANSIVQPPKANATDLSKMATGRGGAVGNNVTYSAGIAASEGKRVVCREYGSGWTLILLGLWLSKLTAVMQ